MKSKSGGSNANKPSLDVLVDSLLQEAATDFQDTPQLKWEWEHYLRLSGLIQKIREREAGRDSQDNKQETNGTAKEEVVNDCRKREEALPEFIQWLERNEVELNKINIKSVTDGLGLITKVPLKSGDLAFSIPKSIVLSVENARNSKLSVLIDKDPILHNMQNVLMAVFLLYEKYVNPESFWKSYIRIMPTTFDTVAYYSEEEMSLLKLHPRAFREALRMFAAAARQYAYFHTTFKNSQSSAGKGLKKVLTYNRYIWAVSAVATRLNNWPHSRDTLCLIPLLDLCNHGEGVISTDFDDKTGSVLCYAANDFEKGTEFRMFYGHRSSIDFLIHNGFVPNSYRDDVYLLDLSMGSNSSNRERKMEFLRKFGMQAKMTFQLTPEVIVVARKLFAYINIFIASEDKLKISSETEEDALLKSLEEPTPECLQYLIDRLELMKRVAESNHANAIRIICKTLAVEEDGNAKAECSSEPSCSRPNKNVLQLLRNEMKLLEMILFSCKDYKVALEKVLRQSSETPSSSTSDQSSEVEQKKENGEAEPHSV